MKNAHTTNQKSKYNLKEKNHLQKTIIDIINILGVLTHHTLLLHLVILAIAAHLIVIQVEVAIVSAEI